MLIYVFKHPADFFPRYTTADMRRLGYGWWKDARLLYAIRYWRKVA